MAYELENKFVQICLNEGNYFFTSHFNIRRSERKISEDEILNVIINGNYESAEDSKFGLPRMKYVYNNITVIIEINITDGILFITCYKDEKNKEI